MKETAFRGPSPGRTRLLLVCIFSLLSATIYAQTVTGTVSSLTGEKLAGVSVIVKGSTTGTSTDAEGKYQIAVSSNATLVFSSVGYLTLEVPVNGRTVIDVSLATDNGNLGEVVVTALGISKESRRLGYAATNVKPEDVTVNRTANLMNSLQGKVAGVNISLAGHRAGGTSKIRIPRTIFYQWAKQSAHCY